MKLGTCPVCRRSIRLLANGTIGPHGDKNTFPPKRCAGWKQKPADGPPAADAPKPRKLWRVTQGTHGGPEVDPRTERRPESMAKVYAVYLPNAARRRTHDFMDVWVDERDGYGWRLYERVELAGYGTGAA